MSSIIENLVVAAAFSAGLAVGAIFHKEIRPVTDRAASWMSSWFKKPEPELKPENES